MNRALKNDIGRRTDYIIIFLLLCVSGNMVFISQDRVTITLSLTALILTVAFFAKRRAIFKTDLIITVAAFSLIMIFQAFSLSFISLKTFMGVIVRIYVGYVAVKAVTDFARTYVGVLVFISVLSWLFYLPDQIINFFGGDFRTVFLPIKELVAVPVRFNIGLYNFQLGENFHRNAGFFWEGGAFAGYLLIGIIFLAMRREKISLRRYRLSLLILILTLVSTFSTMGYIVLPFALFLHLPRRSEDSSRHILSVYLALILVVAFVVVTSNQDFMGQKISEHLERIAVRDSAWELTRFGSAIFDWEYISERPVFGWGANVMTRYALHPELVEYRFGNGLTDFAAKFGLGGLLVFLLFLYRGLRTSISREKALYIVFMVSLILNGEIFFNYPLFWGMMFLDGDGRQKAERPATEGKTVPPYGPALSAKYSSVPG